MIASLVDEAVRHGARQRKACEIVGITARTLERWRGQQIGDDRRAGPRRRPANALSPIERSKVLRVLRSTQYRDMSPKYIVPALADLGVFLASESTMYRLMRQEGELEHRGRARRPTQHTLHAWTATGPDQLWSWDITYLPTPIRGVFVYLYLFIDVWSRKIVGWDVYEAESAELGSQLFQRVAVGTGVDPSGIVLHADNGGPMKGSTMLLTLERLGVMPSFSRPSVSNDNPFSEAVFRTLKYVPSYPRKPFQDLEHARTWVAQFVRWYNDEHHHSGIRYVTPSQRHAGADVAILRRRSGLYQQARRRRPERWSGAVRNWNHVDQVTLNGGRQHRPKEAQAANREAA